MKKFLNLSFCIPLILMVGLVSCHSDNEQQPSIIDLPQDVFLVGMNGIETYFWQQSIPVFLENCDRNIPPKIAFSHGHGFIVANPASEKAVAWEDGQRIQLDGLFDKTYFYDMAAVLGQSYVVGISYQNTRNVPGERTGVYWIDGAPNYFDILPSTVPRRLRITSDGTDTYVLWGENNGNHKILKNGQVIYEFFYSLVAPTYTIFEDIDIYEGSLYFCGSEYTASSDKVRGVIYKDGLPWKYEDRAQKSTFDMMKIEEDGHVFTVGEFVDYGADMNIVKWALYRAGTYVLAFEIEDMAHVSDFYVDRDVAYVAGNKDDGFACVRIEQPTGSYLSYSNVKVPIPFGNAEAYRDITGVALNPVR